MDIWNKINDYNTGFDHHVKEKQLKFRGCLSGRNYTEKTADIIIIIIFLVV